MPNKTTLLLEWDRAKELINTAQKIAVLSHRNPDPDAIGSMLGMYQALIQHDKDVIMAVDGTVPSDLLFLKDVEKILPEFPSGLNVDLVISLDSGDLAITGENGAIAFDLEVPKLVIDHHAYNEFFGSVHIVGSDYVSTTEAIVELMKKLEWEINVDIATPLLVGIMSDTQVFKVGPISPRTFSITQELIATGLDYREIIERVFVNVDSGQLQLLGYALSKAVLEDHVIWASLTPEEILKYDPEGKFRISLANELIKDKEAYISASFKLKEEGLVSMSFRAIPGFNVGRIAEELGGGGHVLAAGCRIRTDNLQEVMDKVLPMLKEEAKNGSPKYLSV